VIGGVGEETREAENLLGIEGTPEGVIHAM